MIFIDFIMTLMMLRYAQHHGILHMIGKNACNEMDDDPMDSQRSDPPVGTCNASQVALWQALQAALVAH